MWTLATNWMEVDIPGWLLVPPVVAFVVWFWLYCGRRVSKAAGFSRRLEGDPGKKLRESGWGSGFVNGAMFSGTLKLIEYRGGWVLRASPFFGGGFLWLPREKMEVGPTRTIGLFKTPLLCATCGENDLQLFKPLSKLIES